MLIASILTFNNEKLQRSQSTLKWNRTFLQKAFDDF